MVRFKIQKCKLKFQMCYKDFSSVLARNDKTKYIKLYYKYQGNCNHQRLHFLYRTVTKFYQHTFN